MRKFLILFVVFISALFNIYSQDTAFEVFSDENENTESHYNHLSFFLGMSSNTNHGEHGFAIGTDYLRYVNSEYPKVGFGLLAELAFHEHMEFIIGVPLAVHPIESFKFQIAPCYFKIDEEDSLPIDEIHETNNQGFLLRLGAAYEFHTGKVILSPALNADISGSKFTLVYGLNIGFGF